MYSKTYTDIPNNTFLDSTNYAIILITIYTQNTLIKRLLGKEEKCAKLPTKDLAEAIFHWVRMGLFIAASNSRIQSSGSSSRLIQF